MSEDPSFGGIGSADAISSAAQAISGIKSDMADIEASAKSISKEMSKVSKASVSRGGSWGGSPSAQGNGNTGYSKDQGLSLGAITQSVGGAGVVAMGGVAVAGGIAGMATSGSGFGTAALATGGFRDLRVTAEQGLLYERSRFGFALATGGDFGKFRGALESSMNSFNVQDREVYAQQFGQLSQLYGLNAAGTTVGARNFGSLMTSMQYAGMDQSQATSVYNQMYGANSYYNLMAMGVQTRDVQGNPMATYQIANQVYDFIGGGRDISAEELQRAMQPGSGLRVSLEQAVGVEGANLILTDLQRRVSGGGQPLTEEAEQLLGTEDTQGMEGKAALEEAGVGLLGEYVNDATAGVALMTEEIKKATEYLRDLEGPLRELAGAATTALSALETFAAEMPKSATTVQNAFSGLASFLGSLLGSSLGGAAARGAARAVGRAGVGRLAMGALRFAGPVGLAATGVAAVGAGAIWAWDRWLRPSPEEEARNVREGTTAARASQAQAESRRQEAASSGDPLQEWLANNGQGTIGVPQYAEGDWFVEKDKIAKIHYGEMVVPNRIAQAVRHELDMGQPTSSTSSDRRRPVNVNINLTLQNTSEVEAMRFAERVKKIIDTDAELLAVGSGRF